VENDDIEGAFRRYEANRKPRTSRIQAISSANTWMSGVLPTRGEQSAATQTFTRQFTTTSLMKAAASPSGDLPRHPGITMCRTSHAVIGAQERVLATASRSRVGRAFEDAGRLPETDL
ncbi:hypothetical protein, partial [Rhizobium ruizarguesonis]|uniref:hypothetical protein n=1 Tax=Rhizobium ruizarguesonis TaxID=2081791 RepID=UPI001A7EA644